MSEKEFNFLDILLAITKHIKFIFFTTLVISIIAIIYSLAATKYWKSSASIIPVKGESAFNVSDYLGMQSSFLDISLQPESAELIMIMRSRDFSEDVVDKFNLVDYFDISSEDSLVSIEEAVSGLREKTLDLSLNDETGLVTIAIETKDKFLSAKIANYYWEHLDRYNRKQKMTKGREKRIFLKKRVADLEETIDSLLLSIKKFQDENQVFDIDSQTTKLVSLYSDLISEKLRNSIALELSKKFVKSDLPELKRLKYKNSILSEKISGLKHLKKKDSEFVLSLSEIPDLQMEYSQLKLNLLINKKVYEFLYPQYESAKIEETRDLPTINIVDRAVPAGRRSKPRRTIIVISAFLAALILSVGYSLLVELAGNYMRNPVNQNKWNSIKSLIFKNDPE
ncbi:MAG TPA: Wzz/FepE/Etk N-terminal domain-containing protein [Candidatus Krumholzibacteriaceae bacterium]|nr:Wzz/FepE/Etk N-terminal domain-containing protein [Candidatus Krumholzibacteriaceae bacterium]